METKKGKKAFYLVLAILLSLTLSGCGSKKSMRESPSYKDTKHMVIDILKTPEGKKALLQSTKGENSESGDSEESGGSESSNEEEKTSKSSGMKTQSKEIAKIVKQESKKQMKSLSSDPEFQKAVIAATKTPEFQNALRIEMIQIMTQMQQGLMKSQGQKSKKSEGGSEESGESEEGSDSGGGSEKKGG